MDQTRRDYPKWKESLPNALTMARVALAVAFFIMLSMWRARTGFFTQGGEGGRSLNGEDGGLHGGVWLLVSAGVFVVAAVTDALDGHLARKWKVVSVFGRVMDPFADKLLVLGAFVLLCGPAFWVAGPATGVAGSVGGGVQASGVAPWMVVVILGRELLITSLRGVFESRGVSFAATASGKWKMILQSVCVPVVLVAMAWAPTHAVEKDGTLSVTIAGQVARWTVWATVAVSAWSGLPYITRAMKASRELTTAP